MDFLKEHFQAALQWVEERIDFGLIHQKYSHLFFYLLSILLSFFFGRMSRNNQMNQYLDSFKSQVKIQLQVENKLHIFAHLHSLLNWMLLGGLLLMGVVGYIMNTDVFLNVENSSNMFRELSGKQYNKTLLLICSALFVAMVFLKKVISLVTNKLQIKRNLVNDNKQIFIQKFFHLIGEEMKLEIRQFFLDQDDDDFKSEKLLREKLSKLTDSLTKTEAELLNQRLLNQVANSFIE